MIKPLFAYFVAGALGVSAVLLAQHLYQDHQALHAIINLINQNAAKQAK